MLVGTVRTVGAIVALGMVSMTVVSTMPQVFFEKTDTRVMSLESGPPVKISSYGGNVNVRSVEGSEKPVAVVETKWNLKKPGLMRSGGPEGQELSLYCGDWSLGTWCGRGDWNVATMPQQKLEVSSVAGDVNISARTAQTSVSSAAGDVTIRGVNGDIHVRSSGGDVDVAGSEGNLDIQTAAGSVEAVAGDEGNIKIKTSAGDVKLVLPPGEYQIKTQSSLGGTSSAFSNSPNAKRIIDISTSVGDITILNSSEK